MKLFVGFDMQNKNIILFHADSAHSDAEVENLHFSERIFSPEFYREAQGLLAEYFTKKPSLLNLPAYVCLPNAAVGIETFNLPNVSIRQMWQALDTEIANEYVGRAKGKKINKFLISRGKQYTIFGAVYFDKNLISDIYKLLTEVKVFPKETTFSGNALLNSVFSLMPKMKGKNFVFADMHLDYTEIAVSSKGKTIGAAVIPHGTALLNKEKVELEYMRTNHEAGELAVINAREMAKAKALTALDADPSVIPEGATVADYAVEGAADGEYSGDRQKEETVEEAVAATQTTSETVAHEDGEKTLSGEEVAAGEEVVTNVEDAPAENDEFFESEEDEEKRLAEEAKTKLKKIKVYRKMPKRYPKFMMRELPETEEGFLFENFRIIAKWILLYARQASLSEYITPPEFILVNMPEDKRFLLDKMNEEQGDGIQFRAFTAADKLVPAVRGNLNLLGCLYTRQFNKTNNF